MRKEKHFESRFFRKENRKEKPDFSFRDGPLSKLGNQLIADIQKIKEKSR